MQWGLVPAAVNVIPGPKLPVFVPSAHRAISVGWVPVWKSHRQVRVPPGQSQENVYQAPVGNPACSETPAKNDHARDEIPRHDGHCNTSPKTQDQRHTISQHRPSAFFRRLSSTGQTAAQSFVYRLRAYWYLHRIRCSGRFFPILFNTSFVSKSIPIFLYSGATVLQGFCELNKIFRGEVSVYAPDIFDLLYMGIDAADPSNFEYDGLFRPQS